MLPNTKFNQNVLCSFRDETMGINGLMDKHSLCITCSFYALAVDV
jgi:hypothetical protein